MTSGRLRINVAAATDPGLKRHHNEDNYAVWSPSDGRPHAAEHLLVLCDGMGGSNAGEVASSMAVEALVRAFGDSGDNDAGVSLGRAIETANREVWEHTRSRPELEGMGTTCTALAVRGDEVTVGHVGDSRAYLIRSGRANQLTQDHSLVAQLVQSGQLTPAAPDARRAASRDRRGRGRGPPRSARRRGPRRGPRSSSSAWARCPRAA